MLRRLLRRSLPLGAGAVFAETASSDAAVSRDPAAIPPAESLDSSTRPLDGRKLDDSAISSDPEEFTVRSMTDFCLNESYSGNSLLELSGRLAETASNKRVQDRVRMSGELVQRTPLSARSQQVFQAEVEAMISDQLLVSEVVQVLTGSRVSSLPGASVGSWTLLREEFPCLICLDVLACPHNLKCGHSFCFECKIDERKPRHSTRTAI